MDCRRQQVVERWLQVATDYYQVEIAASHRKIIESNFFVRFHFDLGTNSTQSGSQNENDDQQWDVV